MDLTCCRVARDRMAVASASVVGGFRMVVILCRHGMIDLFWPSHLVKQMFPLALATSMQSVGRVGGTCSALRLLHSQKPR